MGKLMLNNISYTGGSGGTNVVPNPPEIATDDLTSIKIDNTVYNLAGGDVADVEVNGESVLDANHIAQIKSYKTLTQAEYDALPSSKLTDDVLYCITDAGIVEEQQFAPVIYSLEERQVGTWIDGKPLYAKTYPVTFTGSYVDISIDSTYEIKILNGGVDSLNNDNFIHIGYGASSNDMCGAYEYELGKLRFQNFYYQSRPNGWLTIFYTKTTDIPGSGDWTTSGVPTVHYFTTEHVVGTDEDDKTIYEKTWKLSSTISISSSGVNLPSEVNSDLLSVGAIPIKGHARRLTPSPACVDLAIYMSSSSQYNALCVDNWGYISRITIQYTKSSS